MCHTTDDGTSAAVASTTNVHAVLSSALLSAAPCAPAGHMAKHVHQDQLPTTLRTLIQITVRTLATHPQPWMPPAAVNHRHRCCKLCCVVGITSSILFVAIIPCSVQFSSSGCIAEGSAGHGSLHHHHHQQLQLNSAAYVFMPPGRCMNIFCCRVCDNHVLQGSLPSHSTRTAVSDHKVRH